MPIPSHVLVDTNVLWHVGHPDFQKIVQLSRERRFNLVVPHIVWEERRTQILEKEMEGVRSLQTAYDKVHHRRPESMLGRLLLPPLRLWAVEQMIEASKAHMVELARKTNIEVIPLDPTHAERAWARYFDVEIPFRREEVRENRRKDIPDSWIFEAAIDLYSKENGLIALCCDEKLQHCFDSIGVPVFKSAGDLVQFLEAEIQLLAVPAAARDENLPHTPSYGSALATLMESAQTTSQNAERTILGVVGYLGIVPKVDLESIIISIGMDKSIARNAAERLALNGLIQDTGNTFIPKNRQACDLAAAEVEALMIGLVVKS